MQEPENIFEMEFPLRGLDVVHPTERPPAQTCTTGQNVRAYEPSLERGRGGMRPGYSRYINAQVAGVEFKVQHLNIVTRVDEDALAGNSDESDYAESDLIDDPSTNNRRDWNGIGDPPGGGNPDTAGEPPAERNPGRRVRRGGSPRTTSRNRPESDGGATGTPTFVQSKTAGNFSYNGVGLITPDSAVQNNSLLVIVSVSDQGGGIDTSIDTVTDTQGNTWQRAVTLNTYYGGVPSNTNSIEMWYCIHRALAQTIDITVTYKSGGTGWALAFLEFSGVRGGPLGNTTNTLEDTDSSTSPASLVATCPAGTLTIGGTNRLVLAAWGNTNQAGLTLGDLSLSSGHTIRASMLNDLNTSFDIWVSARTGVNLDESPITTLTGATTIYNMAVCAAFRPAS